MCSGASELTDLRSRRATNYRIFQPANVRVKSVWQSDIPVTLARLIRDVSVWSCTGLFILCYITCSLYGASTWLAYRKRGNKCDRPAPAGSRVEAHVRPGRFPNLKQNFMEKHRVRHAHKSQISGKAHFVFPGCTNALARRPRWELTRRSVRPAMLCN